MIRINLLGVERGKTRKAAAFDIGRQITLACSLILVAAVPGIGWWYWSLDQEATRVEAEIEAAQREQARLKSLLTEVAQFEAQRAQLQQRVQLIEQLRAGQTLPVQLLDHISRSVPEMLWLTDMEQKGETLTIQGRANTLPAVSDFVANLGESPILTKPLDLADTQVETLQPVQGQPGVELYKFTVKASIDRAAAAKVDTTKPVAVPAAGGGGGGAAVR